MTQKLRNKLVPNPNVISSDPNKDPKKVAPAADPKSEVVPYTVDIFINCGIVAIIVLEI